MQTVTRSVYGPPEVLRLIHCPVPSPGPGEVLVKVRAVSVNLSDWEFLTGKPHYVRLMGLFRPQHKVLGSDVAGVVEKIGSGVTTLQPGEAVFGDIMNQGGGFAEFVSAPAKCWVAKPDALSFEAACCLPQTGCIAVQGIRDVGRVKSGEHILINGAGGGSGTLAIPLAKSLGATVTAVDNSHKQDVMRQVGADHVIDYTQTDYTATGATYDHILDLAAYRPMSDVRRALKPGGRYLMVGGSVRLLLKLLLGGPFSSRWHGKKLGILGVKQGHDLTGVAQLVEAGTFAPVIDEVMSLPDVPEALRRVGQGRVRGKIVIKPS